MSRSSSYWFKRARKLNASRRALTVGSPQARFILPNINKLLTEVKCGSLVMLLVSCGGDCCLEHASLVAKAFLMSDCVVVEIKELEPAPVGKVDGIYQENDEIPGPKVMTEHDSDLDATVIEITLGDHLGALLDTI
ncbi:hypothetical protein SSX86_003991 [Deinandra increscens subsp. villosa]|uniref:DUF7651 domain-containing protein n=1 Tax=Deinandra increscens subsp. villosa TaxID=3103831 RepID=A0AAP0DM61_9ASTR